MREELENKPSMKLHIYKVEKQYFKEERKAFESLLLFGMFTVAFMTLTNEDNLLTLSLKGMLENITPEELVTLVGMVFGLGETIDHTKKAYDKNKELDDLIFEDTFGSKRSL